VTTPGAGSSNRATPDDGSGGAGPGDGFETRAIHAGQAPDPVTGAVVPPISLATTFAQEAVGQHRGFEYARSGNPTRAALEACLASLEGAAHGFAFASGLAAEDAVLRLLTPGDHVIIPDDAYGGTFRLINQVWGPLGITHTAVPLTDTDALEAAWRPETRLVWVETPSNPTLSIVDIAGTADAAHRRGVRLVVDNTFATPYLQRPLGLGADLVVHSTTKYLGGHSDVVGGFVATNDPGLAERVGFYQNAAGGVPGPMDCYLVMRGVKTLAVRMDRHSANAASVVEMLAAHPAVSRVLYPGLPAHPGHRVAGRQMRAFGGMVSFVAAGGEAAALDVARSTRLFTLAESLGAVESLIEHPHRMTHASAAGSALEVEPGLVRLSVGLETAADLVADLQAALDRSGHGGKRPDNPVPGPDR
jgi:cystathionine gamma-synthase